MSIAVACFLPNLISCSVIRNTDNLGVADIHTTIGELAERARLTWTDLRVVCDLVLIRSWQGGATVPGGVHWWYFHNQQFGDVWYFSGDHRYWCILRYSVDVGILFVAVHGDHQPSIFRNLGR